MNRKDFALGSMDSQGRIYFPREIREIFQVKPGEHLYILARKDQVKIFRLLEGLVLEITQGRKSEKMSTTSDELSLD